MKNNPTPPPSLMENKLTPPPSPMGGVGGGKPLALVTPLQRCNASNNSGRPRPLKPASFPHSPKRRESSKLIGTAETPSPKNNPQNKLTPPPSPMGGAGGGKPKPQKIRTRFAPSPTGNLHIGGARTALFNWICARQTGGEFILRFEDTDTARSTKEFAESIKKDLQWLGLHWDGEPQKQSARANRHRELAEQLLQSGAAYRCYCAPEELAAMREAQLARGESPRYDRRWRDSKKSPPPGIKPALRLKAPLSGESVFADAVKGKMTVANSELDDFVLLRANGAPTYNLANVADDMDGEITHIIRGDDHLMNTHRQLQLFSALGKKPPVFAHLPMILARAQNESGETIKDKKGETVYERMSKRAAAAGIAECRENGFLPEAVVNYLARLSWAKGDAEIFDANFLLAHFSLATVTPSPARHNPEKMQWLNREHLHNLPPEEANRRAKKLTNGELQISDEAAALILPRAETLRDFAHRAKFFQTAPPPNKELLVQHPLPDSFPALIAALDAIPESEWHPPAIKTAIQKTAKASGLKFPQLAMPLRVLLTAQKESPDITQTTALLGKPETLKRLSAFSEIG